MKTNKTKTFVPAMLRPGIVSLSLLLVAGAASAASSTPPLSSGSARDSDSPSAANSAKTFRTMRASTYRGTDVMSSDGRKVGDIVDFIFDVRSTPHLAYVVVTTGGFLDIGGDARAVPAGAITLQGDSARINITRDEYMGTAMLRSNQEQFLADRSIRESLATAYRQKTGVKDQSSRPQPGHRSFVAFSELRQKDAYSSNDVRLGKISDAWVSLNWERAPYLEINPWEPFRTGSELRYVVPLANLQQGEYGYTYQLDVTDQQVFDAKPVSETDGVKMIEQGDRFNLAVLQVTEEGARHSSAMNSASSSSRNASKAEAVRTALNNNNNVKNENVQVATQNGEIILRGEVKNSAAKTQIGQIARSASSGMKIDNQLTVQNK